MATSSSKTSVGKGRPAASSGRRRILRIGILLGGKMIEERLVRERTEITIGQSSKNTFSIPVEGLPRQFTLFGIDGDTYTLHFLKHMDGRISDGAAPLALEQLRSGSIAGARQEADHHVYTLSAHARGKINMGELTILFQFVVEPPVQPKPMLPASVRGTFADRLDPRLTAIVGASVLLRLGVVVWALLQDPEIEDDMASRAYNLTFKQETFDVEVEKPKPPEVAKADGAGEKKPDAASDKKPDKRPDPGRVAEKDDSPPEPDPGAQARADAEAVRRKEEAVAFANALTGGDDTGADALGGMQRMRPVGDLGKELEGVKASGTTVAIGNGGSGGSRGDGDPKVGTGTGPKISGPGRVDSSGTGKEDDKGPTGRITVGSKSSDDDTSLTPDAVLGKIQSAYMNNIKRCYTTHLKVDPSARGKVALSFTVNESGRATGGRAKGFADEVDSCITSLMGSWTFGKPIDADKAPTTAEFSITLQLVPD